MAYLNLFYIFWIEYGKWKKHGFQKKINRDLADPEFHIIFIMQINLIRFKIFQNTLISFNAIH